MDWRTNVGEAFLYQNLTICVTFSSQMQKDFLFGILDSLNTYRGEGGKGVVSNNDNYK